MIREYARLSGAPALAFGLLLLTPNGVEARGIEQATAERDSNVTPYPAAFFGEFRPVTALDMIGRIPGFQFDGGTFARGFAGTAGNVLIDGERPPTRSDTLAAVLSRIPASQVLRIDLVRGGAGGVDMQGKAVVANVVRRPDAGVSGAVSVNTNLADEGGLSPGFSIQAQRQRDGRSLDGAFSYNLGSSPQAGQRNRYAPDGAVLLQSWNHGDVDYAFAEATGVYEGPLAGGRVRANILLGWNASTYSDQDVLIRPGGLERSVGDNHGLKGEAGLRWTRSLPRGATLEIVGFQQVRNGSGDSDYETPDFTSQALSDNTALETIVSANLKFAPRGAWTFEIGTETAWNRVEDSSAYRFNASPVLLPGDDTRVAELRSESFGSAVWTVKANLSVEASLRYELSRITAAGSGGEAETRLAYLKPRLAVAWTPRPGDQINLKVERNADQLSFGAFTASASFTTGIFGRGNPDIRPATVWLAQARYEHTFGQGSVTAEASREWLDDVLGSVIVEETPPGASGPIAFNITRNVGAATRDTLKSTLRLPLDDHGLTGGVLSASLQWRRSRTEDPVTHADRRLNGEIPFQLSVGLSRNLVRQRISWSVSAAGGYEIESFGPRTASSFVAPPRFNASLSWRPDERWSLSGGLSGAWGDPENAFSLYAAPRPGGALLYEEVSRSRSLVSAYVGLRRAF